MTLAKFNEHGNLRETITLTYAEFKKAFGFNESRKKKIEQVLVLFRMFKSYGCKTIYITGSFVTKKENPGDIDICVDGSGMDYIKILREQPDFFSGHNVKAVHEKYECHFAEIFDKGGRHVLNKYKTDKEGHPRGFVIIDLSDNNI